MNLLLDTHALLWAAHEPEKLSVLAASAMRDGNNQILVSAVSAMEIATKARKGRLEYDSDLAHRFVEEVTGRGFELVSISCAHAQQAGRYKAANQDPWDRLLAAQAHLADMTLVSCDSDMAGFNVKLLW